MVFLKCIDSGCRDWPGGVYMLIPGVCITVLLGKRPTIAYGLQALSQANENTSRIRWIIVRASFND